MATIQTGACMMHLEGGGVNKGCVLGGVALGRGWGLSEGHVLGVR